MRYLFLDIDGPLNTGRSTQIVSSFSVRKNGSCFGSIYTFFIYLYNCGSPLLTLELNVNSFG